MDTNNEINLENNNKENNNKENNHILEDKNKYLNKIQLNKIKKLLVCFICRDILYEPTTLYCQHTFCNECLEKLEENSLVECPLCHHKGLLVPSHNYKINEIIEKIFTKEELKLRLERYNNHNKQYNTIDREMKRQIKKEVWYNEINQDKTKNNNNNQNNQFGNNFFFPLNL